MRQWFYPAKRHSSTELVFTVVLYAPHVRTDDKGKYVRAYLPYVSYPIVGVRKGETEGTWDVMMNDGYIMSGVPEDTLDVYHAELGNGWGTVHGEHYLANTWNSKARQTALENGQPFYPFMSADRINGRIVPTHIVYVPTKPQRNDTWSCMLTTSERNRAFAE